jgi:hypothetical protein
MVTSCATFGAGGEAIELANRIPWWSRSPSVGAQTELAKSSKGLEQRAPLHLVRPEQPAPEKPAGSASQNDGKRAEHQQQQHRQ